MRENNLSLIKVKFPDGSEREVFEGISLLELSAEYQRTINLPLLRLRLTMI